VGSNDGFCADRQNVIKRFVGDVGDIHDHTDAIHFADYFLAEVSQAIVRRFASGGIRPIVAAKMRKRHRQYAHPPIHPEHCQVICDLMPALDSQNNSDLLLANNSLDIACAGREFNLIRILVKNALHGISEIERPSHSVRPLVVFRNGHREEGNVDATLSKAREIDLAVGQTLADIHILQQNSLKSIVVSVDAQDSGVNALCFVSLLANGQRQYKQKLGGQQKAFEKSRMTSSF
jgi:hypothetical protein